MNFYEKHVNFYENPMHFYENPMSIHRIFMEFYVESAPRPAPSAEQGAYICCYVWVSRRFAIPTLLLGNLHSLLRNPDELVRNTREHLRENEELSRKSHEHSLYFHGN